MPKSDTVAEASAGPPRLALRDDWGRFAALIATGWLLTNLGLAVANLPLKFLLKEELLLSTAGVSAFLAIGQCSNYVKPIAGILTDSVPLFGTRRRHYLLLSLTGTGLLWLLLTVVPRSFGWMLGTYWVLYTTVVFTSTTLGGVMVEAGNRFGAAGRMTAQRIATFKIGAMFGDWAGGFLADLRIFAIPAAICAAFHLALVPLFSKTIKEPRTSKVNRQALSDAGAQLRGLLRCKVLLYAAGMVFLIAMEPGFLTPLLFYQSDTLGFSKGYIGFLMTVNAATGLAGAALYYFACRRLPLGLLTGGSILLNALGTLSYFFYRTPQSALIVTAIVGITTALAMLPVYDLAARATPKGSEALGYSLMMSVWNLTNALGDWAGSRVYDHFARNFEVLIWVNVGTTLVALLGLPLLPRVLLRSRDGDPAPSQ